MTHRARPRVHLLTGAPVWEVRRAKAAQAVKFTKRQKAARKPLLKLMADLQAAVRGGDWRTARTLRSAAWDAVGQLADDLTREERKKLWEHKLQILAGEDRARRAKRQ
ncbi:hypothetical protein [Streptomyces sp. NBC_00893]|uniref:hypothetical protein n=1 Tax=Streptomyces sp. NBC_00893 TaxID=2975862 RepID=UPI002252A336|nr:hypothetical protein [Streptomyces sp. NBC_00893]MCX4849869.1 hypothetical protein [Streptomyces sp. NBC_00893]